ncbi:hypothetical protein PQO03_00340 [Lentisphaera profundi]|uniref:Uncharacterized protein n=1 Tax=Lentisphaera profundi TaxID=1658616 RepID=A0ABY7VT65_9BACT|nr:hypothetical protein [Lentisphaera profundi]WDE96415.1 hypothetical protein PQO03_00340 [Lentisphaera profundi]
MVKALTGETKPSRSVYWAIIENDFKKFETMFREEINDKYLQRVPASISPDFTPKINDLDLFTKGWDTFMSQKLYRVLYDNDLLSDSSYNSYWDIGFYGGESSSQIKKELVKDGYYDEDLDSLYQEKSDTMAERKAKSDKDPEVIAARATRETEKQVKMAEHRKRMEKRFGKKESNKIEMNYFQADFEFLGWKPLDDAKCDLTGEQGICLRPNVSAYNESFKVDISEHELRDLVEQNHAGDHFFYVHLNAIEKGVLKVIHEIDYDFQEGMNEEILEKLSRTPPYENEGPWFMENEDILTFIGIWTSEDVKENFKTKKAQKEFINSINGQYQEEPLTIETMDKDGRTIVFQNSKDQSLFALYQYTHGF